MISQGIFTALLLTLTLSLASCGVKGRPVAPLEPPMLGTGKPAEVPKKDEKKNTQKR
jgi:predicted small lipoprotein YifL